MIIDQNTFVAPLEPEEVASIFEPNNHKSEQQHINSTRQINNKSLQLKSSILNKTRVSPSSSSSSVFVYKGVGFSLVKSFRSLHAFGINLKVPITAHFPKYDCRHYLPRVGASVGMYFPIDYKCTFSFSIPILTAFYGK